MTRKPALALLLVLLLAGIAHALYWHWSAGQIEARVAEWRDEQARKGFAIAYGGPVIGGYPGGFQVRFSEPRVEAPNGWRWAGPAVTGESALWTPFTIGLAYPGRHEISRADLAEVLEVELARAETEIQLRTDGQVERAQGFLGGGEIRSSRSDPVTFEALTLEVGPLVEAEAEQPQRLAVKGQVSGVVLPENDRNPFGREVELIALDGTLIGEIDGGDPREALTAWRERQGFADLHALEATWGPVGLTGSGRLTLDDALRPEGQIDTRVRGLERTLEVLAERRLIEPGVAVAATVGLAVLPRETDGEGRQVVSLPITLSGGRLHLNFGLGPVPLFRIGPVL